LIWFTFYDTINHSIDMEMESESDALESVFMWIRIDMVYFIKHS
jgi:hypothetical protein